MRKGFICFQLFCLFLPGFARSADLDAAGRFLGLVHPPVPAEVKMIGEALAFAPGEEAEQARFAFSHVRHGSAHFLWLSWLLERDAAGTPYWQVIDAIEIAVPEGERLLLADCRTGDRTDIAALVEEGEELPQAWQAWSVDRQKGRLMEIDPAEVECRPFELEDQ